MLFFFLLPDLNILMSISLIYFDEKANPQTKSSVVNIKTAFNLALLS